MDNQDSTVFDGTNDAVRNDQTSQRMQDEASKTIESTESIELVDTPLAKNQDPEDAAENEMSIAESESESESEAEKEESEPVVLLTIADVIAAAREIAGRDGADISRDEVSRLRQQFSALRKAETDDARKAFVEAGNDEADYVEPESEADGEFKTILNEIKDKKAAHLAQIEAEQTANLERKNAIIAEILSLADDTDNVNRTFPRYRELQDEFNGIGNVPAPEETDVWKRFQDARERFSDNLKINKELRDYDFKKNLEQKRASDFGSLEA